METTFTPPPIHTAGKQQLSRYLLFAGIVLVAVVSVVLAVVLPNLSGEIRNQAWTSVACAGSVNVNLSACNEGCGNDSHCATGMICYKTGTATEGVCRNAQVPTSTTCTTTTPPPLTPTPSAPPTTKACTKSCTFNYDCDLSAGETCVGTNANNSSASIVANPATTATAADLAKLAPDQVIYMGPGNGYKPDSSGKMPFSVISRKATTFFIRIYDITAAKGNLDPQKLMLEKTFSIGANQIVTGTVTLPRCGRYQVDYGSAIVAGTPYDGNPVSHYFWGTVFEIPCQSGCCVAPGTAAGQPGFIAPLSAPVAATNSSALGVFGVAVLNTATQSPVSLLTNGMVISKAKLPAFTVVADVFPANSGASLKFELNGAQIQIENSAPYSPKGDTNGVYNVWDLSPGSYTLKVTPYSLPSAGGQVGESKTYTFSVTQ